MQLEFKILPNNEAILDTEEWLTVHGFPRYEVSDVNHRNKVRTDNRISNIEWVTRSQNSKHAKQKH